ncbi:MAG: hypothetical protein AAF318_06130 [Pseudomonadota bacterium]
MRALIVLALLALAAPAAAGQARCFTSDDGGYDCFFSQFGGDGSFVISAPGTPRYTVSMTGDGVADGFADFGSGNRFLPGPFFRDSRDRACWVSAATDFRICAY